MKTFFKLFQIRLENFYISSKYFLIFKFQTISKLTKKIENTFWIQIIYREGKGYNGDRYDTSLYKFKVKKCSDNIIDFVLVQTQSHHNSFWNGVGYF